MSLFHTLKFDSLAKSAFLATGLAVLGVMPALAQTAAGEPVTIGVSDP